MTKHTPGTMITEQILDKLRIAVAAKVVESVFLGRKEDIVDLRLTIDEVRRLQQILESYGDLLKAAEAALALLCADIPDIWRNRVCEQIQVTIAKAKGGEQQ